LVDVNFIAVDQSFLVDRDSFFFCHFFILFYWQLSQVSSPILQALGADSSRSTLMLLEADLLFIQRGWSPRLLMSVVDFSICVAATDLR
jgi:hypothetical protein